MASEIKLKPCPFCGSRVQVQANDNIGRYAVVCENPMCGAQYLMTGHGIRQKLIRAWNTRKGAAQ